MTETNNLTKADTTARRAPACPEAGAFTVRLRDWVLAALARNTYAQAEKTRPGPDEEPQPKCGS